MDSTTRFSQTVEHYIKYRPGYPNVLIPFMEQNLGLEKDSVIADIGSGTGKLSELFLKNANSVFGIEPNQAMREAGETLMQSYSSFRSMNGTAENTMLPTDSIDFITAGQAFHWFKPGQTRLEFRRILKPGGWVLLIWNKRMDHKSRFMADYHEFLHDYSTDLKLIDLRNVGEDELHAFFQDHSFKLNTFEHHQIFDLDGLIGRYLSCSYAFAKGHPGHAESINALTHLFNQYQNSSQIEMWYQTEVYYSQW